MALFNHITIIGLGLIGSSLARACKGAHVTAYDQDMSVLDRVEDLRIVDRVERDIRHAVQEADLIILATPVGSYEDIMRDIAPVLKQGAVITDVGSVKEYVADTLAPLVPKGCTLIPAHPVAGTEKSGPEAGFATLFKNRWTIITPLDNTPKEQVDRLEAFWQALGSQTECMSASHHDMVLAITSHVPHLIAFNIVGTARHLEEVSDREVIKYSAGGFRDFTRIAASDPTMWRDVFIHNKEAVLEMLGRFSEDLTALQRAIRFEDGEMLFEHFQRNKEIRLQVIEAGQDKDEPA